MGVESATGGRFREPEGTVGREGGTGATDPGPHARSRGHLAGDSAGAAR